MSTSYTREELLKRKLRYQCQYRGTCELDVILRKFIAEGRDAYITDWLLFEQFLAEPEPVLTDWLINGDEVREEYRVFVQIIKNDNLDEKIEIVPYNPNWPKAAEEEISIIKKLLSYNWIIDIQHIGSTAIPGLAAKPIIDIYMGVISIQKAQQAIKPIEELGYQFWADNPNMKKCFLSKGCHLLVQEERIIFI